jgi:hypothetical protein
MSSLRSQDRVSLCAFTFADGRRCRSPRHSGHLRLCYFHARKEAQAHAAEQLGRDVSYFFSGRYLSACDLSAALGRPKESSIATLGFGSTSQWLSCTLAF